MDDRPNLWLAAQRDFARARMKAFWTELVASMTGQSTNLLRFEEVQQRLRLYGQRNLGLQNIPLDKIIGTVGRYHDFTRTFMPRKSVNEDRWKQISALARGDKGFPPIDVYKVGDAYFVIDGNHRVSVARQLGQPTIEAYVTEIPTSIPFDATVTDEELTFKEAYAEFLQHTKLDVLRPDSNVELTEAGMYRQIIQHIDVHKYFMGIDQQHDITWPQAVVSWYDNVYWPMVEAIRKCSLLDEFPNRTEADLYVWLVRHQTMLRDQYGGEWRSPEDTAKDFMEKLD